jgi:S-adenosylmethionine:tRNA ribosyltransferase-isomerase
MKTTDFDYPLPHHLIAQRPLRERSGSNLLILKKNGLTEHKRFSDLPGYLNRGDLLVLNDTKVFPARLSGFTAKGKKMDILLIRKRDDESWEVLSRGGVSGTLWIADELQAELENGNTARFSCSGNIMDVIWKYGSMPLPPYMKRQPDPADRETYQTIFAEKEGSIAAPTAGLHFTEVLLRELVDRGVKVRKLTLHVGTGTFRPVRTEHIREHSMDAEFFEIDKDLITEILDTRASGNRTVCVGTTTTRALEGYMSGDCKVMSCNGTLHGLTDIFIYPGYQFKITDCLITNFHLPMSTPLMLVSALCGRDNLMKAYEHAVAREYRFLSYGDAMLIV